MTTPPVGGTTPPQTTGKTGAPQPGGALGKDAFMQLLVAQMRYQNPMSPVDGQQYMAQLAQFAQVEKLDAITQAQTDATRWQKAIAGQSMLGRSVTGKGPTGDAVSGVVASVTLTDTGARLELKGGGSLGVDDVDVVTGPTP